MSEELREIPHERALLACIDGIQALPHSLWFVVGADPEIRARVADRLGVIGPLRTHRIGEEPDLWARLTADHQPGDIHVVFLEPLEERAERTRWARLNLGREWRIAASAHVLLWAPNLDAFDRIREAAPDLWAHRTGLLWLVGGTDFECIKYEDEFEDVPGIDTRLTRALVGRNLGELFLAMCMHSWGKDLDRLSVILRAAARVPEIRHTLSSLLVPYWWLEACNQQGGRVAGEGASRALDPALVAVTPILASALGRMALSNLSSWRWHQRAEQGLNQLGITNSSNAAGRQVDVERINTAQRTVEEVLEKTAHKDSGMRHQEATDLYYLEHLRSQMSLLAGEPDSACEALHRSLRGRDRLGLYAQVDFNLKTLGDIYMHSGLVVALDSVMKRRLEGATHPADRLARFCEWKGVHPLTKEDSSSLAERVVATEFELFPQIQPQIRTAELRYELARSCGILFRMTRDPQWSERSEHHLQEINIFPDRIRALPEGLYLVPDDSDPLTRGILRLVAANDPEFNPDFPLDFEVDPAGEYRGYSLGLHSRLAWAREESEEAKRLQFAFAQWFTDREWWPKAADIWVETADLCWLTGEFGEGENALEQARACLEHERDAEIDMRNAGTLARLALAEARLARAQGAHAAVLRALHQGLQEVHTAGNLIREPMLLRGLAALTEGALDLDTRLTHARRARDLARSQQNLLEEMKGAHLLARLLEAAGRPGEAAAADADVAWVQARLPGRLSLSDDPTWDL